MQNERIIETGLNKELNVISDIEAEKDLLDITLFSIGDGVISFDVNGRVTMINKAAKELTDWQGVSAIGETFHTVFNIENEDAGKLDFDPLESVLKTGMIGKLPNSTILISKGGFKRNISDSMAPIKDKKGITVGVVLVFRDVTNEKKQLKEIEYLSYHDHLTGLYNRRFLEEELRRLDTPRSFPLTIIMADLNGLKLTNDAFGHAVGDDHLKKVANILRGSFRQEDIVCRYGGDEFIILLPGTDIKTAERIIRKVRAKVNKTKMTKGILSISFGGDTKTQENQEISEMLKIAEDNMYKMKMMDNQSLRHATINTIIQTLYEKNSREEEHSKRVSELCENFAVLMNFSDSDVNRIKTAGRLHDIGKIIVPDDILEKPGILEVQEGVEIRKHPEIGYRILNGSSEMSDIAVTILQHHERWDGLGYPNGIAGDNIDKFARIISIADAFDAMTIKRPYKASVSSEQAMKEIEDHAGHQFDPEYAYDFVQMLKGIEFAD